MTTEELRESLLAAPKNGYARINAEQKAEMESYCKGYMAFIDACKTEREATVWAVAEAEKHGFRGVSELVARHKIKTLYVSHIGTNPETGKQMSEGTMDVRLTPQGTLAEKIRAGGFGLGGVLTPTGIGTDIANGKQVINVDGKDYLLETALKGDVCLIKGSIVDKLGNVYYKGTTKNFCPLMAAACKTVIVEAEKIVEPGEIEPEDVMTPFILVDYIVEGGNN